MENFDVVIVGGGILGTSLAYWLSLIYDGKIAVLEMENDVAVHTSGRNTGVIHRPFYLDPEKRKFFARSAQISYGLWKKYAALKGLPWKECGTIEVATRERELQYLDKYLKWAIKNGMQESEIEFLTGEQIKSKEPNVDCIAGIFCKTDTAVDFGAFTRSLKEDATQNGAKFIFGFSVKEIRIEKDRLAIFPEGNASPIETRLLINCAGGNAIDIAHLFGVGLDYTDLHFRGEYWEVAAEQSNLVNTNIYTVPKHPNIPFLDPHWIVRANGKREIGPNAVLVSGCRTYEGFCSGLGELIGKIFEPPVKNKIKLFTNPEFLQLASEEWISSVSKSSTVRRVRRFIPKIKTEHLVRRGTAGIRSSVIDSGGNFVKEAIELSTPLSYHIINYNSPGATGSPAYTAFLADKLKKNGALEHLKKRQSPLSSFWNHSEILEGF